MHNSPRRIRVLLADDHRLVAEALKSLLSSDFELVGVVEDGWALLAAADKLRPDVVVADITMPRLNGVDAVARMRKQHPEMKVVFLTMHQDVAYARRAMEAGASGYVLKHSAPAELVAAIRAALNNDTYISPSIAGELLQSSREGPFGSRDPVSKLSPRQRQILQLLAEGRSAKEVGSTLGISARTVEFHKYQMMQTLGLHHSVELVHFAIKHGLTEV